MGDNMPSVINFPYQVPIDIIKLGWDVSINLKDKRVYFLHSRFGLPGATVGRGKLLGRFDPSDLPVSRWSPVYVDDIYVLQWYIPARAASSMIPSKVSGIIWHMKGEDFFDFLYAVPLALGISELMKAIQNISEIEIDYLTFIPCHLNNYRSLYQRPALNYYLGSAIQLLSQTPLLEDKICNGECLALLVNIFTGIPVIKGAVIKDSGMQIRDALTYSQRYQFAGQWYISGDTVEKEEFIRDSNYIIGFECSTLSNKDLKGRKVAIVDDLVTSGSTANRCAEILKTHFEVSKVYVFAGGKTI